MTINGQGGSDQYSIYFGSINGPVTIHDTGSSSDTDRAFLYGTNNAGGDTITVSDTQTTDVSSSGNQTVNYNGGGLEQLTVIGGSKNDTFNVTASPTLSIFLDGGGTQTIPPGNTVNITAASNPDVYAYNTGFTGNTTNGSAVVSNVSNTSGLTVGQTVTGAGIPTGTTILAVDVPDSTITLSGNATANGTGVSLMDGVRLEFKSGSTTSDVGYTNFETVNFASAAAHSVTLVGDQGKGTVFGSPGGVGVDTADNFVVTGTDYQQFDAVLNGASPVHFQTSRLVIDTYALDDIVSITPYADNIPTGWGVAVTVDGGTKGSAGDQLIYNGVNGVSENINVVPSATNAGQIRDTLVSGGNTNVATVNFTNVQIVNVNGNDGSQGDTDNLTFTAANANALMNVQAMNMTPVGSANDSLLTLKNATGNSTLLTLGSAANFSVLNVNASTGTATLNVVAPCSNPHVLERFNYSPSSLTGSGVITDTDSISGDTAVVNYTGVASVTPSLVPVAVNDTASVYENGSVTTNVLANDTTGINTPVVVSIYAAPSHGNAMVVSGGNITYTPAANYSGGDSYMYKITDAAEVTSTATVTMTVTWVNQQPTLHVSIVNIAQDAGAQSVSLTGISAGPNDPTQTLTVTVLSNDNPTLILLPLVPVSYISPNATGTLNFTPATGQSGTANITVQVQDNGLTANGGHDTTTQTFTITVNANQPPVAVNGTLTMRENQTGNGTLSASDPDSLDTLTYYITDSNGNVISHGGGNGMAVITNAATGNFTYTPNSGFIGGDTFFFKAKDNHGADSNVAQVVVTIVPPTLQVSSFAPTSTGFTVLFNQAIDPITLNLYDTEDVPAASDVTLVGASTGNVHGSLVVNAAANAVTFIKTGSGLAPDTYTVMLSSASDGFIDSLPAPLTGMLDGNANGTVETIAFSGNTTGNSTLVTGISSTAGLVHGQSIVGAGIPAGDTIDTVGSGNITLSLAATRTGTVSLRQQRQLRPHVRGEQSSHRLGHPQPTELRTRAWPGGQCAGGLRRQYHRQQHSGDRYCQHGRAGRRGVDRRSDWHSRG